MEITTTFEPGTRYAWRSWLVENHATATEIWMLYDGSKTAPPGSITYLDAVEEALCFGWIDGIKKKSGELAAQRFTPRRKKSHWTELNKERARRMVAAGRMSSAGERTLPDLDPSSFHIPSDIDDALRADDEVWKNFQAFPALYQRVRVGYVAESLGKDPEEYTRRLTNLLERTKRNEMYGNWNDAGMPQTAR